jgi:hypothetical protein
MLTVHVFYFILTASWLILTEIYGSTTDSTSYTSNVVTITHSESAAQAGSDDPSGTLQVHKDNFALYNVNVKNTVRFPPSLLLTHSD